MTIRPRSRAIRTPSASARVFVRTCAISTNTRALALGARISLCLCASVVAFLLLSPRPASADDRVINSKHDLSSQGPGPVRALGESQVCIFCHTPHNASPAAPLWNRANPESHYRIYSSSTTQARVDQPGGPSKLCLSCHDGTIALGMVISRETPIPTPH